MVDVATTPDTIETRADAGTGDAGLYAYWMMQEKIAEREDRRWQKQGRAIVKRYRDERPENVQHTHRFNILWSNVQTLIPTLYGRTPKPDVERRFKDNDPVGRYAATLLERSLAYCVDQYDFDSAMRSAVEDRLLPGRGVVRVMYVPTFGEGRKPAAEDADETNKLFEETGDPGAVVDNEGDEGASAELPMTQTPPDDGQEVVYEEARCKYVFWEDYREGPARVWEEVPWVRYRSYLTRKELIERFGAEKGKRVSLDYTPKGGTNTTKDDPPPDAYKKATVHEIWDRTKKEAVWIAPETPDLILDRKDDPLRLPGFFPNPDPLLATMTTETRVPVPDYIEYQDQARDLDTLTSRIERLQRALKVSGVYAGEEKQTLQQLIDEGTENRLIPVHDWGAFTGDKGGLANLIQWVPIQQIAEVMIQLYNARDKAKQVIYEITGLADIIRGASVPTETATAQQIKSQYATLRIRPQQQDVGRFARDLFRMMAYIVAEHFSPKTISLITGYPQLQPVPSVPPQPQPSPQVLAAIAQRQAMAQQPQAAPPMPGNGAMPPNGAEPGAPQVAPPAPPDPALVQFAQQMAQWQQAAQAAQAVQAKNTQLQTEFDAAVALMKQDAPHDFRIDIEADSTIAADETQDKQDRVEFLQQVIPLLETVVPLAQGNPPLADVAKEITLFALRGFRVSRTLEETFSKAFDAIAQMPPNPKVSGQQGAQKGSGNEAAELQADTAIRGKEIDTKALAAQQANAIKAQQVAGQHAVDVARLQNEAEVQRAHLQIDAAKLADQVQYRAQRISNMNAEAAEGLV